MSNRRPFVGGNWKMNGDLARSAELADDLAAAIGSVAETVDVAARFLGSYLPCSRIFASRYLCIMFE